MHVIYASHGRLRVCVHVCTVAHAFIHNIQHKSYLIGMSWIVSLKMFSLLWSCAKVCVCLSIIKILSIFATSFYFSKIVSNKLSSSLGLYIYNLNRYRELTVRSFHLAGRAKYGLFGNGNVVSWANALSQGFGNSRRYGWTNAFEQLIRKFGSMNMKHFNSLNAWLTWLMANDFIYRARLQLRYLFRNKKRSQLWQPQPSTFECLTYFWWILAWVCHIRATFSNLPNLSALESRESKTSYPTDWIDMVNGFAVHPYLECNGILVDWSVVRQKCNQSKIYRWLSCNGAIPERVQAHGTSK